MPSHPPDDITDEREQTLWRHVSRLFEQFCGEGSGEKPHWPEREAQFLKVLDAVAARLRTNRGEVITVGAPGALPYDPTDRATVLEHLRGEFLRWWEAGGKGEPGAVFDFGLLVWLAASGVDAP